MKTPGELGEADSHGVEEQDDPRYDTNDDERMHLLRATDG